MAVKCILTGQTPSVLDGVTENVQTQIDDKQSKITANGILKGDGNGNIAAAEVGVDYVQRGIFYAIYNETTFAELKAAYDAGMSCACKKDGVIYSLAAFDASRCTFSTSHQPTEGQYGSEWHFSRLLIIADIYCQKEDDGTTTWSTSNESYLPDVKSLEDALDEIDSDINSASVYAGDGIEPEFHQNGGMIFNARFSNPNLLVNWYFGKPVNQRGQTSYKRGSADRYGIDCWKMMTATPNVITIGDGYLELSQNALIGQLLEDPYELCDKRVTASALTTVGLVSFSVNVPSKAELSAITEDLSIGSANITVAEGAIGYIGLMHTKGHNTMLRLRAYGGHTINYIAAKLELGSVQTLAHQDSSGAWVLNEIPDYAEQLRRCQRQLIPLSSYLCPAVRLGVNQILFFVPLPVTMRTLPTIMQNGFQVLSKTGEAQTGFTFSVSSLRSNGVIINASKTGHGMTDAVLNAGTLSLLSAEL